MASRYRVLILDANYPHYEAERAVLEPLGAEVLPVSSGGDPASVQGELARADAVLVREAVLDAGTIGRMSRCRVIVRYGVGVDNIDLEAARERRIYVANVPDYGADEVAEHTVALMLAVWRRVAAADRAVRAGRWGFAGGRPVLRLAGRVLGIVGFGRIGRRLYQKVRGFGFRKVLVYDPFASVADEEGVEPAELDRLCREADVISLHAPLTPQTRALIDARRLGLMKPTAILINTARGPIVDEEALLEALEKGRLLGAGLDTFTQEPLPSTHPLRFLDNVVLTDHTAWYSEESLAELQQRAAEEVARVLQGMRPVAWLNRWE